MEKMIKGYKVFKPDWTCGIKGSCVQFTCPERKAANPSNPKGGYGFCKNATECFSYYPFNPANKVAEVIGYDVEVNGNRCHTYEIEVVREVTWQELLDIAVKEKKEIKEMKRQQELTVYIIERDSPLDRSLLPQVEVDGKRAVEIVKKEYYEILDKDGYAGTWKIDSELHEGECVVSPFTANYDDYEVPEWKWRITKRVIPVLIRYQELTLYVIERDYLQDSSLIKRFPQVEVDGKKAVEIVMKEFYGERERDFEYSSWHFDRSPDDHEGDCVVERRDAIGRTIRYKWRVTKHVILV